MTAGVAGGYLERIQGLAHAVMLLSGWRRGAVAFGAGAIGALALAPLDILPAFLASFTLLVWLLDGAAVQPGKRTIRRLAPAFQTGWWFGFGYFIAGLWWLGAAFIIESEQFLWALPLGVIGLPAGLALFMGLGAALSRLFWSGGFARIFALAAGLGCSEWLRSWVLTGFPWNGFGQVFANHLVLAQGASIFGADGFGLIAVAIFASPALVGTGANAMARWALPGVSLLALVGLALFGALRLHPSGGVQVDFSTLQTVPGVKIRIMQPNLSQHEKNRLGSDLEILTRYFKLSDQATSPSASGIQDITHLIWPESAFPFLLEREPQALERIRQFLPDKTTLITGAVRAELNEGERSRYRFYNSIHLINKETGLGGTYDKAHLVPFGEFLPFAGYLSAWGLEPFVRVLGGFTAATKRKPLAIDGFPPIIPLVCFESIFATEIETPRDAGGVFINVTNDAWFGATPGPYQHLAQARLRAIEFGYPLLRAANSGVSAIFDPYGRVIVSLGLQQAGILDAPLPASLNHTIYRDFPRVSFVSVMICFWVIAGLGMLHLRRIW